MTRDLSMAIRLALAEPMEAPVVGDDGKLPEWVHCVSRGRYLGHPTYPFEVGEFELQAMAANFVADGIDLVVDYEHQTLNTEINGMPAPAMGWIDRLEVRENGIWGHIHYWTEQGAKLLQAREYRYQSPVIFFWHEDRHTGQPRGAVLHSIALTNKPFLAGDLNPVVNRTSNNNSLGNTVRNVIMLSLLGLVAASTDAEQDAAIRKVQADHEALCARLGLDPKTTSLSTALRQANTGMVPMSEHLSAVGTADRTRQTLTDDQVIVQAKSEGRLTPAQEPQIRSWLQKDRVAALRWLASQSAVVPVTPIPTPKGAGADTTNTTAETVLRQLKLNREQFAAAKAKHDARHAPKEG